MAEPVENTIPSIIMYDQDNNPVSIPVSEAQKAYQAGYKYGIYDTDPTKISIINNNGAFLQIDRSQRHEAFEQGYRPATPEEIEYNLKKRELQGTLKGTALTTGAGLLSGATIGLSDIVLGQTLSDEAREELNLAREFNPGLDLASNIVGGVAPALLTGGASSGVTAASAAKTGASVAARQATKSTVGTALRSGLGATARTISAPARYLDELGLATEQAVGRVVGETAGTALGRVGQTAARWAGRGAVEGAVFDAGTELGKSVLQDGEINAEKILAALGRMPEGALYGGIGGGLLGGTGKLTLESLSKAKKGIESFAQKMWGESAPGLGDMVVTGLISLASGVSRKDLGKLTYLGKEGRKARKSVFEFEKKLYNYTDDSGKVVTGYVSDFEENLQNLFSHTEDFINKINESKIKNAIKSDPEHPGVRIPFLDDNAAAESIVGFAADITNDIYKLLEFELFKPHARHLNNINKKIESIIDKLIKKKITLQDNLVALDNIRKVIRDEIINLKYANNPLEYQISLLDHLNVHYDKLKNIMSDITLFGRLGDFEHEFLKRVDAYDEAKYLLEKSLGITGYIEKDGQIIPIINKGILEKYIKNIGTVKNYDLQSVIDNYVAAAKNLAEISNNNTAEGTVGDLFRRQGRSSNVFILTDEESKFFRDVVYGILNQRDAINKFAKNIDEISKESKLYNQYNKIKEIISNKDTNSEFTAGLIGALIGSGAEILSMQIPLAYFGLKGLSALSNPINIIHGLHQYDRVVERIDKLMKSQADNFIKNAVNRAKQVPGATKKIAKKATPILTIKAMREEFDKKKKEIEEEINLPEEEYDRRLLSKTGDVAPYVYIYLRELSRRKTNFLYLKMPKGFYSINSFQPHLSSVKYSDFDISKFMRYVKAAEDPLSVLDDLQEGKVSREGIEALKELYPHVYEEMKNVIAVKAAEAKTTLPYNDRIQLGILFDIPTDVSLQPDFIMNMQNNYSMEEPKVRGSSRRINIAKEYETTTDRISK